MTARDELQERLAKVISNAFENTFGGEVRMWDRELARRIVAELEVIGLRHLDEAEQLAFDEAAALRAVPDEVRDTIEDLYRAASLLERLAGLKGNGEKQSRA